MPRNTTTRTALLTAASACLLALGACGSEATDRSASEAAVPSTETVAALIANAGELSTMEMVMKDAGLSETFDGTAAYTIFAPTDAAIAELGESFSGDEARPALIAMLRQHIVPGYLTEDDIAAAIESAGGAVELQTMGAGTLSFSRTADGISVSLPDGSAMALLGEEMLGANGVVMPVAAVLIDFDPDA